MTGGRRAAIRAALLACVVAAGLAVRYGPGANLPFFIWKYAGSALWATMVYLLVALATPRWSNRRIATIAIGVAIAVELFRLVHTPALDAFRLTAAGALLVGRVFSLWNMLAYAVGVAFGAGLDICLTNSREVGGARK